MPTITLSNVQIINALLGLRYVKPHNALSAVKLGRLRKILAVEAEPIIAAFDEAGKRHAKKDDAGAPVVQHNGTSALSWNMTGTPFYEMEDAAAFEAETKALYDEETVVTIPVRLLEKDLEQMDVSEDVGDALLPFVQWAE